MNKNYRVIWCHVRNIYIVVSELASRKKIKNNPVSLLKQIVASGVFAVAINGVVNAEPVINLAETLLVDKTTNSPLWTMKTLNSNKDYLLKEQIDLADNKVKGYKGDGKFKTVDSWEFKVGSLSIFGAKTDKKWLGMKFINHCGLTDRRCGEFSELTKHINVDVINLDMTTNGEELRFDIGGLNSKSSMVKYGTINSIISDSNNDKESAGATVYVTTVDTLEIDSYYAEDGRSEVNLGKNINGNRLSIYNVDNVNIKKIDSKIKGKTTSYIGLSKIKEANIDELVISNNRLLIDQDSNIVIGKLSVVGGGIQVGRRDEDKSILTLKGSGEIIARDYGDYTLSEKNDNFDNDYSINHLKIVGGDLTLDAADVDNSNFIFGKIEIDEKGELFLKSDSNNVLKVKQKEGVNVESNIVNKGVVSGVASIKHDFINESTGKVHVGKFTDRASQRSERALKEDFGQLTISNYVGKRGSELHFWVELREKGKNSQLIITKNASGESRVIIHKVSEEISDEENIFTLVRFEDGAENDLKLSLAEKVSDGMYNYNLIVKDKNWLLTNVLNNGKRDYATQSSAYLATQVISSDIFNHRYHDRLYGPSDNGFWTNVTGSFSKFKSTLTDDISSKDSRLTMRIGKDLVSDNEYAVGLMVASGYSSGKSENNNTFSISEKTDYKSYGVAIGAYGTYSLSPYGYVDLWGQYIHTRNKLEWGNNSEKYNAKGLMFSVEAAYAFGIADSIYFQPQAQITYFGVKADDLEVSNYIYSGDRGNVQFRLGGRLFGENIGANGLGSPYVEVNYLHNTKRYKTTVKNEFNSIDFEVDGMKNLFQLKLGSDFNIDNKSKIGAHISHTFGKNSYRDTQLNIDLRYDF